MTTGSQSLLNLSGHSEQVLADFGPGRISLPDYRELCRRYERQQWRVDDLDFGPDRRQWAGWDAQEQEYYYRLGRFPGFYEGELSVAEALAPYQAAMPREDQRAFVATQIADEIRHVGFFERFYRDVLGFVPAELGKALPTSRQSRSPAYRHIVHELLPAVTGRLRADPEDEALLVQAVTLYHLIIEATLALDQQGLVLREFKHRGLFPGFWTGFAAVARDEVRHVLFGMRFLRDMVFKDPAHGETIVRTVVGLLPLLSQILAVPCPGHSPGRPGRFLDAVESLERRLHLLGLRVTLPRPV